VGWVAMLGPLGDDDGGWVGVWCEMIGGKFMGFGF